MRKARYKKGLTLVELTVALIVTSIVVTAVVTLANALDTVYDVTDDTSRMQAQIRFATVKISDLIRHCKLVCYASADEMAVWRADDDNDGQISISELVYIEAGAAHDHLWLYTFTPSSSDEIGLDSIDALATNWWSAHGSQDLPIKLIWECSDVTFYPNDTILPPNRRFVTISFEVVENGIPRHCQIDATLRGWAGNLLNEDGSSIVSDDD